jgi:hypothetical protein
MTTVALESNHIPDRKDFLKKINIDVTADAEDNTHAHVNDLIKRLSTEQEVDFTHDEEMRQITDELFEKNPRAFGYVKAYSWKKEERDQLIADLKEHFEMVDSPAPSLKSPMPLEQLFVPAVQEPKPEAPPPPAKKPEKREFKDVNLGLAFIHMQAKAFDITEERIHKLIKQLSHLNAINKDLSSFINAVTRNKESGKADFSADPDMRAVIDRIYEVNPKIFGNEKVYAWSGEKQLDVLLSSLDAEVKTRIAEINQVTMFINVRFDERVQFAENSRKVMDMLIRHCESIISKYHKT